MTLFWDNMEISASVTSQEPSWHMKYAAQFLNPSICIKVYQYVESKQQLLRTSCVQLTNEGAQGQDIFFC